MAALAAGGPPGGPPPGPGDSGGGSPTDHLSTALDALHSYLASETDDVDKATVAQHLAGLQKVLAKDQKEQEAAAGITPVHRGMRKALSQ
jgi:hypothetical protein